MQKIKNSEILFLPDSSQVANFSPHKILMHPNVTHREKEKWLQGRSSVNIIGYIQKQQYLGPVRAQWYQCPPPPPPPLPPPRPTFLPPSTRLLQRAVLYYSLLIITFSALGQVKQTTYTSRLGFIPPSDPGHITVKLARKKSKPCGIFYFLFSFTSKYIFIFA